MRNPALLAVLIGLASVAVIYNGDAFRLDSSPAPVARKRVKGYTLKAILDPLSPRYAETLHHLRAAGIPVRIVDSPRRIYAPEVILLDSYGVEIDRRSHHMTTAELHAWLSLPQ